MTYLISGASRGIGLELTLLALESGHNVHALARDPHRSGGLNSARKDFPDLIKVHKCDVTNNEEIEALKGALLGQPIDILINNAGVMAYSDEGFADLSLDDIRLTFETNIIAPFNMVRNFLDNLKLSENPKIANITSLMGSIEDNQSGGYYAYRMSKSALNMFNKCFSIDHSGIISLCLHPGWVRTEMGGRNAPVMTRESARGLLQVIENSSADDTGRFMNYKGEPLLW